MIIILWRFKYLVGSHDCIWVCQSNQSSVLSVLTLAKNCYFVYIEFGKKWTWLCNNIPIGAIPSLYGESFFELRGETILTRFCTLLILFKEPNEAICSKNFSGSLNGSACLIIPSRKDLLRMLPFGNLLIHMSMGLAFSVLVVELNKLTSLLPKIE